MHPFERRAQFVAEGEIGLGGEVAHQLGGVTAEAAGIAHDVHDEAVGIGFEESDFGRPLADGEEEQRVVDGLEVADADIANALAVAFVGARVEVVRTIAAEALHEIGGETEDGRPAAETGEVAHPARDHVAFEAFPQAADLGGDDLPPFRLRELGGRLAARQVGREGDVGHGAEFGYGIAGFIPVNGVGLFGAIGVADQQAG